MRRRWKAMTSRVFYGWWIVVLGSLINGVGAGLLYYGTSVFFLPLKRDLMVSSAAISLVYGAARLEGGIEGVIVGPLIDRFGPRTLIIGGAILTGASLILVSTVHSFTAFFLVYILGVSLGYNAGFFHPVSAALNSWFIRRRGIVFAILTTAGSIGGMVGAPLLSHIILNFGWRTGMVIVGLIVLGVALPAALPIHRSPEVRGLYADGTPPAVNHADDSRHAEAVATGKDFTVKEALRTLSYWLMTLAITLRLLVTVALTIHFIPLLVWKGLSEAHAAYLLSLFTFINIFSMLVIGWIGDRWNKSLLCAISVLPLLVVVFALVQSQAAVALYAFPIALAIAMANAPLNWALIGDFFGRRSYATLRGIMGVGYGTATFLAPVYAGWVFDRTGSYDTALITFSITLLVTALLFAMLRHPSHQGEISSSPAI